jgi:hypothetical protein
LAQWQEDYDNKVQELLHPTPLHTGARHGVTGGASETDALGLSEGEMQLEMDDFGEGLFGETFGRLRVRPGDLVELT